MLREQRGSCSTKHLYVVKILADQFPETEPVIVHRVYKLDRDRARELMGDEAAHVVPQEGLVDVHRYLTIILNGQRIAIDATFAGPPRDGRSSVPLVCGPGRDYPSEGDPDVEKRLLKDRHCDPGVREPLITALSKVATLCSPSP